MKRRDFIKTSTLSGIALTSLSWKIFSFNHISYDELIGKGNPQLYGTGFKLRKNAHDAFLKMKTKALKDGIKIQIVSSYRNFDHQNRIWTRKYDKFTKQELSPEKVIKKIIEYSTIPGTSRHHWATDIDIIDSNTVQPKNVLMEKHFHGNGPYCKLKEWMDKHSESFGYYLVYTNNGNRKGFKYEPWHYTYKPLSKGYLEEYQKINLLEMLQKEKLSGSEHFTEDFINNYIEQNILDINPKLLI